jgi:enediyne biosynthesis protein E4
MNRRKFLGNAAAAAGLLSIRSSSWLEVAKAQTSPTSHGTIQFEEIAQKSGVHFITTNSATPEKHQIETMPGGVALLDYDGDGYLDIYLVNGAAIPSLTKESSAYWNRLFHNNHDGTFTDVTEKAGVAGTGYGMGVAVGDYDNDGRPDLFVANVNGNQLLHNNGDGTFTDVTIKAGLSGALFNGQRMWSAGGGWFDYNNDGLLDLFVVNYCLWGLDKDPVCMLNNAVRGYCHPKFYAPLQNTLYRNNGDGTFTDVSQEAGIAGVLGKGMSVSFADFDGDGFIDAFVANDTTRNFLFHNVGGKRFEEQGLALGVAYNAEGKALSGMGSDFRDVNNDGRPDIWHTAIEHETLPLYLNRGTSFSDSSALAGLALATAKMSGWGNGMFDFDNDGWKDLFVARSNVVDNISAVYPDRRYVEPNSVFRNMRNGKFQDVSATAGPDFQLEAAHRGVAFGDLDNDGKIDAVVTVLNGPVKIFRNISTGENHWVLLNLLGRKSSRMPIGAQIHITTEDGNSQWNQVTTAVGYASSSDSRVHFGLGNNRYIREMQIRWPSGIRQQLRNVQADRIITIEEPRS